MQTAPQTTPDSQLNPQPAAAETNGSAAPIADLAQAPNGNGSLDLLLNPQPTMALQLAPASQAPAIIEAKPLPLTLQQHKARRKGRIAALPKIHRDMVNRMLSNGVPYKNIVAALERVDFIVKERNISNWATGGYLEWKLEQDLITQNRLDQDHLVDSLRREDASDLAEVGLQAAATRLSQIVIQKASNAEDLEANLPKFSQMVGLLRGLSGDLATRQKQRDDSRRTLGSAHDVNRIKNADEKTVRDLESFYSYPEDPEYLGLDVPAEYPLLPPTPTSEKLEHDDEFKAKLHREQTMMLLRGAGQNAASTAPPLPAPNPQSQAQHAPASPGPDVSPIPSKPGNGAAQ